MNVTKNQIDETLDQYVVVIAPEDYSKSYNKKLNEYQRTQAIHGFRPGKAPKSLIIRIFGEKALSDSLNESLNDGLRKVIEDNQGLYLPEPLESDDQTPLVLKDGETFTFKFDYALRPKPEFEVSDKKDKFTLYKIMPTDQEVEDYKKSILANAGEFKDTDAATEDDNVVCDFTQGESKVENVYVAISKVEGDARNLFLGCKAGDEFDVNVNEAFTNDSDRAAMLRMKKDEIGGIDPQWHVRIVTAEKWVPAEESQETYDKIFGEDKIHSAEEFTAFARNNLSAQYSQPAQYRLSDQLREHFIEKAGIKVSEDYLRRLLKRENPEAKDEDIEKDFAKTVESFKWDFVVDYLLGKFEEKVTEDDLRSAASYMVQTQYSSAGYSLPEDIIKPVVDGMLKDESQINRITSFAAENKVLQLLRSHVGITEKEVTPDEYSKIINA